MSVDATAAVAAMSCIMSVNSGSQLTIAEPTPVAATVPVAWAWTFCTTSGSIVMALRKAKMFCGPYVVV